MGFIVYLGEMLEVEVCINLRRRDIRVPQQFLNASQIMARLEQMSRE